ncbi:hypothetical protein QJS10_CPA06g02520 [Acorus calamus]|uniref:Uncharacterized protein n=1 Tax=Acorus calamus TaxID=4465 RepID=A0AAV9ELE6_ACOCL|nr:hypothetical protein QJS10_CPA06g02520 [Acorus calamus]
MSNPSSVSMSYTSLCSFPMLMHSLLSPKKNFTPSLEATPPHVVAAMSAKLPFLSNTIMKPVAMHLHIIPQKSTGPVMG